MAKIDVFNQEAKAVKSIELSDAVFGIEPNQQAMYDAILVYQAGLRQGTHATLTRAEVSGTGKKPFRQKGTGRARQGSTRATQWRHGGIAFGPQPRKYDFKLNRKVRQLADEDFDNAYVSMRNIPNALVVTVSSLNVYDIVNADKVVFTEKAAEKAGEVFA